MTVYNVEAGDNPREMHQYNIKGTLDLSEIKDLDREVPLRVAAVRNNRVVYSEMIDLRDRDDLQIDFDLDFYLPHRRCGLRLLVNRGDVRAAEIVGLDSHQLRIAAADWKESKKKQSPFRVEVGKLTVPAQLYRHWFLICRRYTIRGRVVCRRWYYDRIEQQWVFVDHPVPGATVEAYDIDRWWWLYFSDLIRTATTDINGYFEMSFIWCCRRWFPFPRPWLVDPDIFERIRELLRRVEPPIGPLPDPPIDPEGVQDYLMDIAGRRNAVTPLNQASGLTHVELDSGPALSAQALTEWLPAAPDLEALHIWPWWHRRDCAPDILFRITQPCEGAVQTIYQEGVSATRWNIPTTLNVTLEANDKACCLPVPDEPPCGDCLTLKGIGCKPNFITPDLIGTSSGPPDLRGYAYPGTLDRPFGGKLNFWGEFGEAARPVVDYYRIEYRKDGMPPGTWLDAGSVPGLLANINDQYAGPAPPPIYVPAGGINFGPADFVGDGNQYYKTRHKYERDNPGSEPPFGWIWKIGDLLFVINSSILPQMDGLYRFRLVAYRQAVDGTLVDERVMPLCGTEDDPAPTPATLMVRIDNRHVPHAPSIVTHPCGPGTVHTCTAEPDCDFVSVVKNEGMPEETTINPCDFETIADTDSVTIHFKVTAPNTTQDAHLLAYHMTAHFGESGYFNVLGAGTLAGDPTPQFGPNYSEAVLQGASRPYWAGGSFKVTLPGSAFEKSCAYLLRLRTWKRTTNGCTGPYHFHWNVCEFSFCVIKPE